MRITETFTSIQGEGAKTGEPTTFIRFAGCNLRCPGCDTPQATTTPRIKETDTAEALRSIPASVTMVCFTGGEPMLQADEWLQLARELDHRDHKLTMETNGTIWLADNVRKLFSWIVVSPKTSEIYTLPGIVAADEVKFLFAHPNTFLDSEEYRCQYRKVLRMNANAKFCVQPWLTGDSEEDEARIARTCEFCIENDVRLSLQVHKMIGVR